MSLTIRISIWKSGIIPYTMWRSLFLKGVNTNYVFGPKLNEPTLLVKSGDDYLVGNNNQHK